MTSMSPPGDRLQRATIRDVARLAQVGTKTVSRVMNGEPNVAPATAERVRRAAAALHYVPDVAAGNLRRGDRRTQTLGLLVGSVSSPFFAAIHRAVEDATASRGLAVFTSSSDEDEATERNAVGAFLRRRVDGLVLATTTRSQAYLDVERDRGTPVVFIDRVPNGIDADAVVSDNAVAAARITRHLVRHGHRRIGLLLDRSTIWTARERRRGVLDEAARSGLGPHAVQVVPDLTTEEDASMAVRRLLRADDPPTAIVAAQDLLIQGAVRALHHLRLQHRVALVGFDDVDLADVVEPGITVLAQRPSHIGRLAAERLIARLDGWNGPAETIEVATDLIERGSGEIRPPVAED